MGPTKILFSFFLSLLCTILLSQEQTYNSRSLNITMGDSLIKTHTSNTSPKRKKVPNAPYYWYSSGKIQYNFGGYSGKLIHGKYEVFDRNNKLIKQGNFEYGLKQGIWMDWYSSGLQKEITMYENGILEGEKLSFNPKGAIISKISYHKGKLDGKAYFFTTDTTIVKEYDEGKEKFKKKKTSKLNIFKKKNKKLIRENENKEAVNDSVPKPKKSWLHIFKRSKKSKIEKDEKS